MVGVKYRVLTWKRVLSTQFLAKCSTLFSGDDPSPLLPPIEPANFTTNNAGFAIYDGGITSDAESRVTGNFVLK